MPFSWVRVIMTFMPIEAGKIYVGLFRKGEMSQIKRVAEYLQRWDLGDYGIRNGSEA